MYHCPMYSQELIKGTLKTIVLSLLSEHDRMYGYAATCVDTVDAAPRKQELSPHTRVRHAR